MTVKTQNAKVILKGGKVSCSCCEEPVDCCMYPAQALEDGLYSASDLPDAVTISGVSYSRSGSGYGNTTNGVILEENVWARYKNGSRSSRACLIQGGVEDQFADTYIVENINFPEFTVVVERQSLCIWYGETIVNEEPFQITLQYISNPDLPADSAINYRWTLSSSPTTIKNGTGVFQNTPVGNYSTATNPGVAIFTVS